MESKKDFIVQTLQKLFPEPTPSLTGWETPFQLLIAILLSGNSTDRVVNTVAPALFARAPDAQAMSALSLETLYHLIFPCGLGRRKAHYIHETSRIIATLYQGSPPSTLDNLIQLPGIGRKTASVFLAIVQGAPTFPVDTHILRLAHRWHLSSKRSPLGAEKDLIAFFGDMVSPRLHLQLIYYARTYCPARRHCVEHCPICYGLTFYPTTDQQPNDGNDTKSQFLGHAS